MTDRDLAELNAFINAPTIFETNSLKEHNISLTEFDEFLFGATPEQVYNLPLESVYYYEWSEVTNESEIAKIKASGRPYIDIGLFFYVGLERAVKAA